MELRNKWSLFIAPQIVGCICISVLEMSNKYTWIHKMYIVYGLFLSGNVNDQCVLTVYFFHHKLDGPTFVGMLLFSSPPVEGAHG